MDVFVYLHPSLPWMYRNEHPSPSFAPGRALLGVFSCRSSRSHPAMKVIATLPGRREGGQKIPELVS